MSLGMPRYEGVKCHCHENYIGVGDHNVDDVANDGNQDLSLDGEKVMERSCKTDVKGDRMVTLHSGSDVNAGNGKGDRGSVDGATETEIYDKPRLGLRVSLPEDHSNKFWWLIMY